MFKNRLAFFLTLLVSFNSLAFATAQDKSFYLKTTTTISKISDIETIDKELNFTLNHEANLSPAIGVGVGYYINDSSRVELIFEHLKFKFGTQSAGFNFNEDDTLTVGTKSIKRRSSGKSLMLNGFVDVLDKDFFKFFVGTGVGVVQIKEKLHHNVSGSSVAPDENFIFPSLKESYTNKVVTKFAYSLMFGTSVAVTPNFNVELMYSWKNFGNVKHNNLAKSAYKGHHFSVGTRFDL